MNDPRPPQNRITPAAGAAPANPAGIRPRPAADLHPISMDDDEPSLADNHSAPAPPTGMEPLALVDDHPDEPSAASKIRAFGVADIDRSSTNGNVSPRAMAPALFACAVSTASFRIRRWGLWTVRSMTGWMPTLILKSSLSPVRSVSLKAKSANLPWCSTCGTEYRE